MKFTNALVGVLIAGFAFTTVAQADSYYVVRNGKTKECTITTTRPTGSVETTVGPDGVVYKTRTEAENAMKTTKVCHTD